MTRDQDALDALLAERYGPPVRQSEYARGPTAEWLRQQAVDEVSPAVDSDVDDGGEAVDELSGVENEGSDVG